MTFPRWSLTIPTFLCLFSSVASAEDAGGCDKFKWSVARELAWFAEAPKPAVSGDKLTLGDNAFKVALKPTDAAGFVMPPEREPKPGTFGATLTIVSIDKPGSYQFALSRKAWIDVVAEEPHQSNAQAYADWLQAARTIYGLGGVILRMAPRPAVELACAA